MSVNLPWWHMCTHACFVVWRFFELDVFAPLCHHLFPGLHFHEHPEALAVVVSLCQIMKIACGHYLEEEVSVVRRSGNAPAHDLTFLCENAIPAVTASRTTHTL